MHLVGWFIGGTVHFDTFCTMTNKYTIISQLITLLHVSTLSCHSQGSCNQYLCQFTQVFQMQLLVIQFAIYQQLHFLNARVTWQRYWLQTPWGWHDNVETCRSVIICEIIVHLLIIVQNNKNRIMKAILWFFLKYQSSVTSCTTSRHSRSNFCCLRQVCSVRPARPEVTQQWYTAECISSSSSSSSYSSSHSTCRAACAQGKVLRSFGTS